MKKIGVLNSQCYFLGKEDGSWKFTSDSPLGGQREVDNEDVAQILDEYWDIANEGSIALDQTDDEEVQIINKWLEK